MLSSVTLSYGENSSNNLKHTTKTFKVHCNCGMCKKTIEGSLKNVKGVEKAIWNKEKKTMEVTFDEDIISLKEIKQKIANVGYDTDDIKASDKTYKKLPMCCQYERSEEKDEE